MLVDCIWDQKSLQAVLAAGGVCTVAQEKREVAWGGFYHFLEKITFYFTARETALLIKNIV